MVAGPIGAAIAIAAAAGATPAPGGAGVHFIGLEDGAAVESPVTVRFGLDGIGVAPAGTHAEGTGHHHPLIDTVLAGEALDLPIRSDESNRHSGGGQTETMVELAPGTHSRQLVGGDANRIPQDPPVMSEWITITVARCQRA